MAENKASYSFISLNINLTTLILYSLCFKLVISEVGSSLTADFHNETVLSRIAFGSCNNQNRAQPLWQHITQQSPDIWIWLGDAVYADNNIVPFIWMPAPLEFVAQRYSQQKQRPEYQEFLKGEFPVVGVWDDHDYGIDRGGKHHRDRLQSQGIFLDFLDEPADSVRRKREGVYVSYLYGQGDKTVKIILLDTRSHLNRGTNCDILGDEQWAWLESQLSDKSAPSLTLIGSGIQVLSDAPVIDKWLACSASYDKLMWLLQETPRVMLLSGDVHFGEFQCRNATSLGYPLYEVTSSGMTSICVQLTSKEFCRWLLNDVAISSVRFDDVVTELNYGMINIDWNKKPVEVSVEIRGENGVYLQHAIPLDHLEKGLDSPRCPIAAEPAPWLRKTAFWCFVYLLGSVIVFVLLRIFIFFTKFTALKIVFPLLGITVQDNTRVQYVPINGKLKTLKSE